MTKQLITSLFGTALLFAACATTDDASTEHALQQRYEDGPTSPVPPQPEPEPEPEACEACTDPVMCADGPSQDQLDEAKKKLTGYLGTCTGTAARDKIMTDFDKNKDGKLDKAELTALLKKIGLGNGLTRGAWCNGLIKEGDKNNDGKISAQELLDFLGTIGLGGGGGGGGTCAVFEDGSPSPVAL